MESVMEKADAPENPTNVRLLGGLLVLFGSGLAGGMAMLMGWIAAIASGNGADSSGVRWNATPEEQRIIFLILSAVMVFGFASVVTGIWQIISGRRNKKMIWLMFGLWILLLILSWLIRLYF